MAILAVYVDDLFLFVESDNNLIVIKASLKLNFKMKDMGKINYCLGISIEHDEEENVVRMNQKLYIDKILKRYGLTEVNPAKTPMDPNGKLAKENGISEIVDASNYQSMVGSLF